MENLQKKVTVSTTSNFFCWAFCLSVNFIRGIILFRLLEIKTFAHYAFAKAWIDVLSVFLSFGIQEAFLHKAQNHDKNSQLYFTYVTLQLVLAVLWLFCMIIFAQFFSNEIDRSSIFFLAVVQSISAVVETPFALFKKNITMEYIARIQYSITIIATVLCLYLAYNDYEIVSLLSVHAVHALVYTGYFLLFFPKHNFRFTYHKDFVFHLLNIGFFSLVLSFFQKLINNIVKIFIPFSLGQIALGFYANAARIAQYPRMLFNRSFNDVALSAYANLQTNSQQLKATFFCLYASLIRCYLLVAGVVIAIFPEFTMFIMGAKWQPLIDIVPVLLITTFIMLLQMHLLSLLKAFGMQRHVVPVKVIQLLIILTVIFAKSLLQMICIATFSYFISFILLSIYSRRIVEYSLVKVFCCPIFGFSVAMVVMYLVPSTIAWSNPIYRVSIFIIVYFTVLILFERENIVNFALHVKSMGKYNKKAHIA